MIGAISSVLGAVVFVYMFYEFSTSKRVDLIKMGLVFAIFLVANIFLPISGPVNAVLYYGMVVCVYLFVFRESVFVSASNTLIMFLIQYFSAIFSSCIVLLYGRKLVDYRYAFRSDDFFYTLIFLVIVSALTVLVRNGLYALNKHFDKIKDKQLSLLVTNSLLFLGLLLYLRIFIVNGVVIAALKNPHLEWSFALRLILGIGIFLWLTYMTNMLKLDYSRSQRKNITTITDVMNYAKVKKQSLTVVYFEFPYYEDILRKYGVKEAKAILSVAKSVASSVFGDAGRIALRDNAFLIMLENRNEYEAKSVVGRFEEEFGKKRAMILDGDIAKCLIGITLYNPAVHLNHKDLILSVREQAYTR